MIHVCSQVDSAETKAFVAAQNALTEPILKACPGRAAIEDRLTKSFNYAMTSCPSKHGSHDFFKHNTGLQNQFMLFKTPILEASATNREVLLDVNAIDSAGTTALSRTAYSTGVLCTYRIILDQCSSKH